MTKLAFLSTLTGSVDDKCRLSIPADYREAMTSESLGYLVFAPGMKNSLLAFPLDYFQALFTRVDADLPQFAEDDQRERYTVIFHASVQRKIDAQGRVTLTKELLEKVGITKEVVFAGERTHFSVWEPSAYAAYRKNITLTDDEAWKRAKASLKQQENNNKG